MTDVLHFWEEILLMKQLTTHRNIVSLHFGGNYVGELSSHPFQKCVYEELTAAT